MKQCWIRLVVITFIVLFTLPAFAGPIAKIPPLNKQGRELIKQAGKKAEQMLMDVPDESQIGIPAYPGSYFVSVVRSNSPDMLSAVNLLSNDSKDKVLAWYKNKLTGWYFDKTMATFYKSKKKLPLAKLFVTPAVIIQDSSPESLDLAYWDLPNAKTRIQLTFKTK